MTLYEFVRQTLEERGPCTRDELHQAMLDNEEAARLLAASRGFVPLLVNMKHSGFIEIDGELVRRTNRKVGRRRP